VINGYLDGACPSGCKAPTTTEGDAAGRFTCVPGDTTAAADTFMVRGNLYHDYMKKVLRKSSKTA
jgi:hypothetical protein